MRLAIAFVAVAVSLDLALAAQEAKPSVPRKGETIVVSGCLRGSALESARTRQVGADGSAITPDGPDAVPVLTYRLDGDKSVLKKLKDKHERRLVDVTGVLRSELTPGPSGTSVGRTRIIVGMDPRAMGGRAGDNQVIPVLDVRSFEGSTVVCGK